MDRFTKALSNFLIRELKKPEIRAEFQKHILDRKEYIIEHKLSIPGLRSISVVFGKKYR